MQFALTIRFMVLMLLFIAFMAFESYMIFWPVAAAYIPGRFMDLVTYQIIMRLIVFSLPILFVVFAFTVIFTHRIAGPLFRLERTLDDVLDGKDVDPIKVRKNDDLQELMDKINRLLIMVKDSGSSSH